MILAVPFEQGAGSFPQPKSAHSVAAENFPAPGQIADIGATVLSLLI